MRDRPISRLGGTGCRPFRDYSLNIEVGARVEQHARRTVERTNGAPAVADEIEPFQRAAVAVRLVAEVVVIEDEHIKRDEGDVATARVPQVWAESVKSPARPASAMSSPSSTKRRPISAMACRLST